MLAHKLLVRVLFPRSLTSTRISGLSQTHRWSSTGAKSNLHKVSDQELPQLQQWLEAHLPESWKIYHQVRENLRGRWVGIPFYTLSWPDIKAVGEGVPDDTCEARDYYIKPRTMSVYSPSVDDARTLLTHPGFIDWTQPLMLEGLSLNIKELVETLSKERGWKDPIVYDSYLMTVEKENLTNKTVLPHGITSRRLDFVKDFQFAFENWPYSKPECDTYFKALMKKHPSVGVFDQDGECLGYGMSTEFSTMGMLFVKPEHRGRGLAKHITTTRAEQKFKDDSPAAVTISTTNQTSINLHERLGFKTVCRLDWLEHMKKPHY